jgi:hypothetical protein
MCLKTHRLAQASPMLCHVSAKDKAACFERFQQIFWTQKKVIIASGRL